MSAYRLAKSIQVVHQVFLDNELSVEECLIVLLSGASSIGHAAGLPKELLVDMINNCYEKLSNKEGIYGNES